MLSLLLEKQKKALKTEYKLRFVNLFLSFVLFAIIIWIITLFPSYVSVTSELTTLEDRARVAAGSRLAEDKSRLEALSKEVDRRLGLFHVNDKEEPTDIIGAITASQSSEISISIISLEGLTSAERRITVQGVSGTRDALSAYTEALSTNGFFEEITLPLSNFVKESDIPFTLDLKVVATEN